MSISGWPVTRSDRRAEALRVLRGIERHQRNIDAGARRIVLHGDIVASTGLSDGGFSALKLQSVLRRDTKAPILLVIDSRGGIAAEGLRCFDALRAHKGSVTTRITGRCDSAATMILAAGEIREAPPTATMIIHQPAFDDLRAMPKRLDPARLHALADAAARIGEKMAAAYAVATGTPRHVWSRLMTAETELKPYEAATLGLVTRIAGHDVSIGRIRL